MAHDTHDTRTFTVDQHKALARAWVRWNGQAGTEKQRLKVMDSTAFSLCLDNNVPILVFDLMRPGNLRRALAGEEIGTLIG